ncbi:FAD/NAD(P)-binding protein [Dokdonella sp.]|uniref:FAD/NAD(P)-binding protein n=1 Tax=Dokdonella sp. TaxID=2291710 RepID=UPI001B11B3ED|nr:FAD/NAD(P)-binding protein [Dokdonella sp.]MBO9664660.1 FAD/NAD(P)-binding protein [Dokdonella sp.]
MPRIAIIGGGAAGAAVVAQFLRDAAGEERCADRALTWIVGDRAPGRGVAYETADEQHLLNVRAANMGLFADRPGDFLDYAAARGIAASGGQFLPRAIYGDYLEATLARLLATARRRVTLAARSTEAIAIRPRADAGFSIHTRDGEEIRADGVVLALGALPPASLPGVDAAAAASGAYAADAWRWPDLARAPGHVLVIGSGLTGVDTLLSAAARWPQARLTAVSRRGRWPALHSDQPLAPYADPAALIARLRERSHLGHWLRTIRAAAGAPDADWRAVLDAVRTETPRLWQSLDARQRARFLRHLRPSWETVRHRMPPQTAAKLRALQDEGRLRLLAARVRGIEVDATTADGGAGERGTPRLLARLQPRGDARERTLAADFVIQATGLESAAASTPHALVRQLVDDGVAGADPLGLGLAARTDGRLLRPDGRPWPGLYALGTLLRGAVWECTGLPEIRAAARDIARELPTALANADAAASSERCVATA